MFAKRRRSGSRLLRFFVAALILCTSFATTAYALTATVEADGYSFSLGATGTSLGFDLFFTSFDGLSGIPVPSENIIGRVVKRHEPQRCHPRLELLRMLTIHPCLTPRWRWSCRVAPSG